MSGTRAAAIRDGLFIAGVLALCLTIVRAWLDSGEAYDAAAYWHAARGYMYAINGVGAPDAYHYSPAFLQFLAPVLALPFAGFLAVTYVVNGAALVVMTRWLLPFVLLTGFVADDLTVGNIEITIALAIVIGFRWPAAWAFVLLSKVTPGVGLLWFVGRREWRNLVVALSATVAAIAISVAIGGVGLWIDFVRVLEQGSHVQSDWPLLPIPLTIRVAAAALLALYAGRSNRAWLVPVAATLAMPLLWPVNFTSLVGVVPLVTKRLGPWVLARPPLNGAFGGRPLMTPQVES